MLNVNGTLQLSVMLLALKSKELPPERGYLIFSANGR